MKLFVCPLLIVFASFQFLLMAQDGGSGDSPANFDSVGEIVAGWSPDQHLWIKGDLRVGRKQLNELEVWLGENAPNWTVVLLQNAKGQSWDSQRGMSAVEFALGRGLSNSTDFGKLTDSRTNEQNGAVFILFLEERKFSYFGSEAFDKRGVGEDQWIGKLDRPAISAMRNGGRIVDAVKDTVSSIEKSFTQKLEQEAKERENAEIQRQRAIEEAKQLPDQLESRIREAAYRASKIKAESPSVSGPVTKPDTAAWLANAKAVREFAAVDDTAKAFELGKSTEDAITAFHDQITRWEENRGSFDALDKKIQGFPDLPEVPALQGQLALAEEGLRSARSNHASGEPLYEAQLEECESALEKAAAELANWQRQQEELERQRKVKMLRNKILIAVAIILLLVALALANRSTRPHHEEALKLFRKRRRNLRGKFDLLFQLMDKAEMIVGPDSQLSSRGFSGTTLSLARKAIREIDELFIMSAATDRVMERAEKLVLPKSVFAMLENVFSPRRFKAAVELLDSKPIGFDREDNLEAILYPERKSADPGRSLLGEPEDYRPFRISFDHLIEEFDERREEALAKIDRLENGIDGLPLLQESVSKKLEELTARTEQQGQAAAEDGWFPLLALRNRLIPSAESDLNEAATTGQEDPVTALETSGLTAQRQVEEGLAIANRIESVRQIDFPAVEHAVKRLEDLGRNAAWVDAGYDEYTGYIEQLAIVAISRSVEKDWKEFEEDIFAFKGRIISSANLAERVDKEMKPLIQSRGENIEKVKGEISKTLDLPKEKILTEENLSPAERVELARRELSAACASLDHGNTTAAEGNFHEIELTLKEADDLLRISLETLKSHAKEAEALKKKVSSLSAEGTGVAEIFSELESNYDPSVLLFSTRFGESVRGQQSIRESLKRAYKRLSAAQQAIDESESSFKNASLIESASLVEKASNDLGFVEHQLGMIRDQYKALKKAEEENQSSILSLIDQHEALESAVNDQRTIHRTVKKYRLLHESLTAFKKIVDQGQKDPFTLFHALAGSATELNLIVDGIKADWEQYDEAGAAISRAAASIRSADDLIHEAKTDRIADSETLTRAIKNHAAFREEHSDLELELEKPHHTWNELFTAANHLSTEALKTRSLIRDELRAAKAAAEKIDAASSAIAALQNWRSSYSVKVQRNTGNPDLLHAQNLLERGDYAAARQAAISSLGSALREKKRAESREADARRTAQAAKRRSMSSSFSSGSSFSSSSSSGFSSSSFSSSSGFSRSGW